MQLKEFFSLDQNANKDILRDYINKRTIKFHFGKTVKSYWLELCKVSLHIINAPKALVLKPVTQIYSDCRLWGK